MPEPVRDQASKCDHDINRATGRAPLCPVCDQPTKSMGVRRGREFWYCLGCEVEFERRTPAAGKAVKP